MESIFSHLILIGLIVLGSLFTYKGASAIIFGFISPNWPTTSAKITKSEVCHTRKGDYANIRYVYTINGLKYEGEEVGFLNKGSKWNVSLKSQISSSISEKYPVGTVVNITNKNRCRAADTLFGC